MQNWENLLLGVSEQEPSVSSAQSAIKVIHQLTETGEPIVLSINGKVELVIRDATSSQQLLELVDRLETIEAIQEGIASIERGEGRPANEVFEEIERKHNVARKA